MKDNPWAGVLARETSSETIWRIVAFYSPGDVVSLTDIPAAR
jgi:hypothetical protein